MLSPAELRARLADTAAALAALYAPTHPPAGMPAPAAAADPWVEPRRSAMN